VLNDSVEYRSFSAGTDRRAPNDAFASEHPSLSSEVDNFKSLGLTERLLDAIRDTGYSTPTPIQAKAIPLVLDGGDVLAAAQTGTGKTAGFTLPVLQRLMESDTGRRRPNFPRCLILTPTRELASQIEASVKTYSKYTKVKNTRLLDLEGQGYLDLSRVEILVLDEADRMLDMGFIHDMKRIINMLPTQRQTLLFSATFTNDVRKLAKSFLKKPSEVSVAANNTHLIKENRWSQVLVFTKTKHGANRLATQLAKDGINADAIHGNKSQSARTKALGLFKSGRLQVLVATDIAARGLDIKFLPNVVNYELPHVSEDYVHRIGRTGRAGSEGQAVSLVDVDEVKLLRAIERLIRKDIPRIELEEFTGHNDKPSGPAPRQKKRARSRRSRGPQGGDNERGSKPRSKKTFSKKKPNSKKKPTSRSRPKSKAPGSARRRQERSHG